MQCDTILHMEKLELSIVANGMNGEGIAKLDGKVYFVEGAVEGDVVQAIVTKENKNFGNAKVENVLQKSEYRCEAKCPYFNICGGCDLQLIQYNKQVLIKQQNVQNLFDKHKLNFNVDVCEKSPEFGYRNKITMYLNKNNKLCFYKKKSNELIEINSCLLIDNNFNKLISLLNAFLKINKEFNSFILKGISIRQIENKYILNLILTKNINLIKLQNYLKLNKINYALYYCINNDKNSNLPKYPCYFVGGQNNINVCENGVTYPVYPMSFLQVNNHIKKLVYDKIMSFVNGYNCVIDAYSGAGLLSAMLSKCNKNVYAIEIDKSASTASKELCKNNNICNVQSICGDCLKELPKILEQTRVDCIVLDPARQGVDMAILESIANYKIKHIVYLSCNPATLTRDLEYLKSQGYRITFAKPYDMFPQTSNVETLVELKLL